MTITMHYHKITRHFLGQCVAVALQLSFQSKHFRVLEATDFDDSEIMTVNDATAKACSRIEHTLQLASPS